MRPHPLLWSLSIAVLAVSAGAAAEEDWSTSPKSFVCRSSTEVREIKTYLYNLKGSSAAPLSCRVDYIKSGITKTLWSSRTERAYCERKASEFAAKLQATNFSCEPLHLEEKR